MPIDFLYVKFILWVTAGGLLISKLSARRKVEVLGNRRERWSLSATLIFILPLIYWCATRDRGYGDTWAYYLNFTEAPGPCPVSFRLPRVFRRITGSSAC